MVLCQTNRYDGGCLVDTQPHFFYVETTQKHNITINRAILGILGLGIFQEAGGRKQEAGGTHHE
jgi:hypothetical protein